MTENSEYLAYLRHRSRIGLAYRNYWLYPRLSRHLSGRVLDVGCGIGDMLRFRPGTIGADINPDIVDWCRSTGLDVHLMSAEGLPFADNSFESVILDNVLEHVPEPTVMLRDIRRVLVDGGKFLVGVPGSKGYASDPDHKIYYDKKLLINTICQHGFGYANSFDMPFSMPALESRLSIYCRYGVFRKVALG